MNWASSFAVMGRLLREEVLDEFPFFLEFVHGRVDPRAAEVIDREVGNDFKFLSVAADWERANQVFLDSVAPVRTNTDTVPITRGRRVEDRGDTVHDRVRCARGTGSATRLDNGR